MPAIAFLLLILGVIGVIVPILPGIPLLVVAALLFTANSPGLRRRLLRSPRLERFGAFVAASPVDGLTPWERVKLRALTALRVLLPGRRRR